CAFSCCNTYCSSESDCMGIAGIVVEYLGVGGCGPTK
ncbi:MAG: hypothetical protein EBR19_06295, partial [Chitinophagaceae bacterium]|nr:hypothetical protein [Chitinophagaceae bacterium]